MERDMALITKILLVVEKLEIPPAGVDKAYLPEALPLRSYRDVNVIFNHVDLCIEAGFLRPCDNKPDCVMLTWKGHEELAGLNGGK